MIQKKFFQIGGPAEIKMNTDGDLELYFFDKQNQMVINTHTPLTFELKPGIGRIRFLSCTLLIEVAEPEYQALRQPLNELTPGIAWDTAETPNEITMPLMNSIKNLPFD